MRIRFVTILWATLLLLLLSQHHNPTADRLFRPHYARIESLIPLQRRELTDDTPANLLPGAIAVIPLPNNMNISFLFTQYSGHVSYTVYFSPGGYEYWSDGLCLTWAVGLPTLYIPGQCSFPGRDKCLSTIPINPCVAGGSFLTGQCNPIETVSQTLPLQNSRYTTTTPLVTINSSLFTVSPTASYPTQLLGHSILTMYTYTWQAPAVVLSGNITTPGNTTTNSIFACANVMGGNGTLDNFVVTGFAGETYNGTSGLFGPLNGTLNLSAAPGRWAGELGWGARAVAMAMVAVVMTWM